MPTPTLTRALYLAVMPGRRAPKTVSPGEVAFYRSNARLFYEAPAGTTADAARILIKTGKLKPSYVSGQRMTAAGSPDTSCLPSIAAMTERATRWQLAGMPGAYNHARLWIGAWFWTLHQSHVGAAPSWHWHRAGGEWVPCDALYNEKPLTLVDLEKLEGQHIKLELLREDFEKGRRTSDVGRPWATVEEIPLDGSRLNRTHY